MLQNLFLAGTSNKDFLYNMRLKAVTNKADPPLNLIWMTRHTPEVIKSSLIIALLLKPLWAIF